MVHLRSKYTGKPFGITSEGLHYDSGTGDSINVSYEYEPSKYALWAFVDLDDCVNYLALNGYEQSAREIHKAYKALDNA